MGLTKELRASDSYEEALRTLNESYPAKDDFTSGSQWQEGEFLSSLMSIRDVREALEELSKSTRLFVGATEWAEGLYSSSTTQRDSDLYSSPSSKQQRAKKLHQVCENAQFAES